MPQLNPATVRGRRTSGPGAAVLLGLVTPAGAAAPDVPSVAETPPGKNAGTPALVMDIDGTTTATGGTADAARGHLSGHQARRAIAPPGSHRVAQSREQQERSGRPCARARRSHRHRPRPPTPIR